MIIDVTILLIVALSTSILIAVFLWRALHIKTKTLVESTQQISNLEQ